MGTVFSILFIAVIAIVALSILFTFVPVMLWISAMASGVYVGLTTLIGMRLRRIVPLPDCQPADQGEKSGVGSNH